MDVLFIYKVVKILQAELNIPNILQQSLLRYDASYKHIYTYCNIDIICHVCYYYQGPIVRDFCISIITVISISFQT